MYTSEIVNLTPHTIHVYDAEGETRIATFPSAGVARVETKHSLAGMSGELQIPQFVTVYGAVEGLPEPQEGIMFVVSLLVRQALPDRMDLASPGELIRDEEGLPIGCKGLSVND